MWQAAPCLSNVFTSLNVIRGPSVKPTIRKSKNCTALVFVMALGLSFNTAAGPLVDAINNEIEILSEGSVSTLEKQAMDARVKAARSSLFPSIMITGVEARRRQDIRAQQSSLVLSGVNRFDNSRYMAIIEQPLFDRELTSALEEAKVYADYAKKAMSNEQNQIAFGMASAYLEVAKAKELDLSYDRTLNMLKTELDNANKKLELNLITSGQLNTIKLHFLNTKKGRELLKANTSRNRHYMDKRMLGGTADIPTIADQAAIADLNTPSESQIESVDSTIMGLRSEIDLLKARAKKEKAKRLPRINAVALYQYDDAAETVFGGPSRIEDYEIGIQFEWDLYKGGHSKHKLREIEFLQRANEQKLSRALAGTNDSLSSHSESFAGALERLQLEQDMVAFRASVRESTEKAFSVGEQDYLSKIDSALLHEESQRNFIEAKYAALVEFVGAHHMAGSLLTSGVAQIESLFSDAKALAK